MGGNEFYLINNRIGIPVRMFRDIPVLGISLLVYSRHVEVS